MQPTLKQRIITSQREDPNVQKVLGQLDESPVDGFSKFSDEELLYQGCLYVLAIEELRKEILTEAHTLSFAMHPGGTKMYQGLKQHFWWKSMKRDECLVFQQVKASRRKTAGMLQPESISEWKWENIAMDFIVGLPETLKGYTTIWVIVDRLTKSAHLLPEKGTYIVDN